MLTLTALSLANSNTLHINTIQNIPTYNLQIQFTDTALPFAA